MNIASRVRVRGPLAPYAPGFREVLGEQGYTDSSAASQLHLLAHVSDWLAGQGLEAGEWTPAQIAAFVEVRRTQARSVHGSERALGVLLEHLRGLGVVPVPAPAEPGSPAEVLLARYRDYYRDYLVCQRALAATTVGWYERVARRFLSDCQRAGEGEDLQPLAAGGVRRFLSRECAYRSVASAKNVASGLRSLCCAFLHAQGVTALPLAQAVPSGVGWRGRSLPEPLDFDPGHLARLLGSCARRRATGRGRRPAPRRRRWAAAAARCGRLCRGSGSRRAASRCRRAASRRPRRRAAPAVRAAPGWRSRAGQGPAAQRRPDAVRARARAASRAYGQRRHPGGLPGVRAGRAAARGRPPAAARGGM